MSAFLGWAVISGGCLFSEWALIRGSSYSRGVLNRVITVDEHWEPFAHQLPCSNCPCLLSLPYCHHVIPGYDKITRIVFGVLAFYFRLQFYDIKGSQMSVCYTKSRTSDSGVPSLNCVMGPSQVHINAAETRIKASVSIRTLRLGFIA